MSILDRVMKLAAERAATQPTPPQPEGWELRGTRNGKPLYVYTRKDNHRPSQEPVAQDAPMTPRTAFANLRPGCKCLNCHGKGAIYHKQQRKWMKCHQCSKPHDAKGRGYYTLEDIGFIQMRLASGRPLCVDGGWLAA